MTTRGAGTADVRLTAQALADTSADATLARLAAEGSAGYVAIERVTGTLSGRSGSFALQHTGIR